LISPFIVKKSEHHNGKLEFFDAGPYPDIEQLETHSCQPWDTKKIRNKKYSSI